MVTRACVRHAVAVALSLLSLAAAAQGPEIAAPFVPTAPSVVERMLELAKVGPDDFVIDLGSGDGRIIIAAAARFGARGFGVDIDADLVAQANANARAAGVGERARFFERDLFATDLSPATVVTIYLLSRSTVKLRDKLYALKPGTRIVSHAGSLGEWKADSLEILDVPDKVREDAPRKTYLYYWVVPAKVVGRWAWSLRDGATLNRYELDLEQRFQLVSGVLRVNGKPSGRVEGRLEGERLNMDFTAPAGGVPVQYRFDGRVEGNTITGSASVGEKGLQQWQASRSAAAR